MKSKKEIIKHKKSRKTNPYKKILIFEKRTQPTKHKKNHHKPDIKRYHITGSLTETARNHTPTPGLTHQRGRPEHAL